MKTLRTIVVTAVGTAIGRAVYENRDKIAAKLTELKTEIDKQKLQDQARRDAMRAGSDLKDSWGALLKDLKDVMDKDEKTRPVKDAPQA